MFLDPCAFGIAKALEANWETIRDEYLSLPTDAFDPWVQRNMHGAGWSVYGLIAGGHQIPGAAKLCPRTSEILGLLGAISLAGFSRMDPGTHIAPHAGWAENEHRLHLGLVVPIGCRLRVANDTRAWREGMCLIFDDAVEHEAWNDSKKVRGNLMVDFLKPGKTVFSAMIPEDVLKYGEGLFHDDKDLGD